MKPRRFPQPWTSEETEACFIVSEGQYRPRNRIRLLRGRSRPPHIGELTDERRSAAASNIAKLPNFRMGGARS